jgi:predicted type IV restriction endonuclease
LDTDKLKSVADLVAGFRAHLADLRDPQTSEAVVRQEYIDPFWEALGWDIANKAHRSPAEKDVLIEAPVGTIDERVCRLYGVDEIPAVD